LVFFIFVTYLIYNMAEGVKKLEMDNFNKKKVPSLVTITFTSGEEVVYHRIGDELCSRSILTEVLQNKYQITEQKENEKYLDSLADTFQLLDSKYKSLLEDAKRLFAQNNKVQTVALEQVQTSILTAKELEWLQSMLRKEGYEIGRRLFSTSGHEDCVKAFHDNCNDKGATLTVVKALSGKVIGGVTTIPWSSAAGYAQDEKAWLFRLDKNSYNRIDLKNENDLAVYHHVNYGPTFGNGHDLRLTTRSGKGVFSYCKKSAYKSGLLSEVATVVKLYFKEYEVFLIDHLTLD
jgi:hypothetical protein